MLFLYLVIASIMLLLGAGIALIFQQKQFEFRLIFGFTTGAVCGFVLMLMVDLLTEVGYLTILVLWGGFLLIWILEILTYHVRQHYGNQEKAQKRKTWGVNITLIGLSIHSITDGFNLSIAAKEHEVGIVLALGILLHRLPAAIVITAVLLRDYGITQSVLRLTPLIIAPFIGAFMGERLLQGIFKELTEYSIAFAAGTLLHVVMDGLRGGHGVLAEKVGIATKIAFIVGLILTALALYFFPEFRHEHVH